MSYICLMVNASGAVAAADSRETFPARVHLDWRQKCFSLPEQKLIWACCGPTLRYGVDILRAVRHILRSETPMEERFQKIANLVGTLTRVNLTGGDPGPFCLLAAQWEENGFTVWDCQVRRGALTYHRTRLQPSQALFLHAGAWHRAMPPFSPDSLKGLSYEDLRETARARVALAIEKDEQRLAQNPKHNQTIGGRVRCVGLRVKESSD
ncbi:MAG: hypothetical protein ACI3VN_03510 [Candidatus Onthomonas sp.]